MHSCAMRVHKVEAGRGFAILLPINKRGERMTQGAVKTTGKRSRAVSAKKKRFLAQHWTLFHNSVFTAQGWSRSRNWRVFQNQSAVLLSVKRGAVYSRTAADSRYLAGTVKSVSRRFRPAGGDQRIHPSEAGSFPRLSAGFAPVLYGDAGRCTAVNG